MFSDCPEFLRNIFLQMVNWISEKTQRRILTISWLSKAWNFENLVHAHWQLKFQMSWSLIIHRKVIGTHFFEENCNDNSTKTIRLFVLYFVEVIVDSAFGLITLYKSRAHNLIDRYEQNYIMWEGNTFHQLIVLRKVNWKSTAFRYFKV